MTARAIPETVPAKTLRTRVSRSLRVKRLLGMGTSTETWGEWVGSRPACCPRSGPYKDRLPVATGHQSGWRIGLFAPCTFSGRVMMVR